ncbi:MAG: pilus assembly protein N-terminal domain-containing protein [Amphiplicatus sp.]
MRSMIAAVSATAAALAAISPASAGQVWLTLDQVRPYELERPAGEIVVGNPGIADITVQDKTRVLLFGKAPGVTNLYIFDEEGKAIDNLIVRVNASSAGMLTLNRGSERTTYACTDNCNATQTVGDGTTSFSEVGQQVQLKLQLAKSSI